MPQVWEVLDFKETLFVISTSWKGTTEKMIILSYFNNSNFPSHCNRFLLPNHCSDAHLAMFPAVCKINKRSITKYLFIICGVGAQTRNKPSILQSLCTRNDWSALLYFIFPFLGGFINPFFSYLLCPSYLPALFFAFLFSWITCFFFCCYFWSLNWG